MVRHIYDSTRCHKPGNSKSAYINCNQHRIHISYGNSYDTGNEESKCNDNKYVYKYSGRTIVIDFPVNLKYNVEAPQRQSS